MKRIANDGPTASESKQHKTLVTTVERGSRFLFCVEDPCNVIECSFYLLEVRIDWACARLIARLREPIPYGKAGHAALVILCPEYWLNAQNKRRPDWMDTNWIDTKRALMDEICGLDTKKHCIGVMRVVQSDAIYKLSPVCIEYMYLDSGGDKEPASDANELSSASSCSDDEKADSSSSA